jgi:hypothetical protein
MSLNDLDKQELLILLKACTYVPGRKRRLSRKCDPSLRTFNNGPWSVISTGDRFTVSQEIDG